ncbi:MAG: hypothetical protein ACK501_09320 [Planctomycetota bacterium]|jgi:hypothetical protein
MKRQPPKNAAPAAPPVPLAPPPRRRFANFLEREAWHVSHHEAGHAVAGLLKGCEFDSVELAPPDRPDLGGVIRRFRRVPGQEVFTLLAGDAADFLATGRRPAKHWNQPMPSDWTEAEAAARRWNHELAPLSRRKLLIHLNREFGRVVESLREPDVWDAVVRIAAALRERRRLTQDECREMARDLLQQPLVAASAERHRIVADPSDFLAALMVETGARQITLVRQETAAGGACRRVVDVVPPAAANKLPRVLRCGALVFVRDDVAPHAVAFVEASVAQLPELAP